jgi:hypothetical protein
VFYFSREIPIIALLRKCYLKYTAIIALALKVLLKTSEIFILQFTIALMKVKCYYMYLSEMFNSTSVKVLLNYCYCKTKLW